MIFTFLLNASAYMISAFTSHISGVATIPTILSGALSTVLDSLNQISFILPVNEIFVILTIFLSIELAIWTFEGAVWLYRHIPFFGH